MADNVTLSSGTGGGSTIAADDIGGIHYQRVKLSFGASGASSDVHADNPVPVTISKPVKFASIDVSTSGNNTIVSGVADSIIRVLSAAVVVATSGQTVQWKTVGSSGELSGALTFARNGGYSASSDYGLFQTATGESLSVSLTDSGSVDGHISYILVTG